MTEIHTEHAGPKSRKTIGFLLIIVGIVVIIAMGILVLYKMLSAPRIASLLPADQTVALIEVDTNFLNGEFAQLRELTAGYESYSAQNMVDTLFNEFHIDFEKDLKPWLGSKMGVALIANSQRNHDVSEVFFIEYTDQQKAREFMDLFKMTHHEEAIEESDHHGTTIYHYKLSNNLNFFFTQHYLVISDTRQYLQSIINVMTGEQASLQTVNQYEQIANNLGNGYLAFGFINLENGLDFIREKPKYNQLFGSELSMYMPLLKIYSAAGMLVSTYKEGLKINTYTTVSKNQIDNQSYFTYQNKYQGKLLKYIPENAFATFAGHNVASQLERFEQLLQETNSASRLRFKGELNKLVTKITGSDLNYENTIAPLLKNEYLFSVNQSITNPNYLFVVEIPNKKAVEKIKNQIDTAFNNMTARANPVTQKVTLEDGTQAEEIIINFESTKKNEEDINGTIIYSFSSEEGGKSIHYVYTDAALFISTNKALLASMLNTKNEQYTPSKIQQTILRSSDEIAIIKLKNIWSAIKFLPSPLVNYLVPFENITYGKEYFDNGIVGEYYLHITPYGQN